MLLGSKVRAQQVSKPDAKERSGLGTTYQVIDAQKTKMKPASCQTSDTVNAGKAVQNNDIHISTMSSKKSILDAMPGTATVASVKAVATPTKNTMLSRARTTVPKSPQLQQELRVQIQPPARGNISCPVKRAATAEVSKSEHDHISQTCPIPRSRSSSSELLLSSQIGNDCRETLKLQSSCPDTVLQHSRSASPSSSHGEDYQQEVEDVGSRLSATPSGAGADVKTARATEELCVAMSSITSMVTERIDLEGDIVDPSHPSLRPLILESLGFAETAVIKKLEGDQGAFNEGVWMMSDTNALGVVLKLVPHQRSHPWRATDSEKYANVQKWCPNIVKEYAFSFPLKIFELRSSSGICKELIVMRRAQGAQLTHHLFHKFHSGSLSTLMSIFRDFGAFLSTIHRVYRGAQHGDCQPSNVFYDESSGLFTLIDVADFGFGPYMAEGGENDVEHFVDGLKTLAQWYGNDVIADCERHLRAGYDEGKGTHSCPT